MSLPSSLVAEEDSVLDVDVNCLLFGTNQFLTEPYRIDVRRDHRKVRMQKSDDTNLKAAEEHELLSALHLVAA